MNAILATVRSWFDHVVGGWQRFWFTPAQPHTLAMIRILAGLMLFYTHLVWSFDLMSFVGTESWITSDVLQGSAGSPGIRPNEYAWSYLHWVESPALLWTLHIGALIVFAMLTIGLFTRVTSVLAFLITVAYCNRLFGSLFGLDQVNAMLAMYLMVGACGSVYSVDRWLAKRRAKKELPDPAPAISTNIAIRLLQIHMCVIYLFGGVSKMKGEFWWSGQATWMAIANYEYQSLDVTWLVHSPFIVASLTIITVFWETFYCALVWPRATRPFVLAIAVGVHGGIAMFLGMITFGLAMLFGNMAFLPPKLIRAVVDRVFRRSRRPERSQGSKVKRDASLRSA